MRYTFNLNNYSYLSVVFFLFASFLHASAQEVSETIAKQRALEFINKNIGGHLKHASGKHVSDSDIRHAYTSIGENGTNYHVFNIGTTEGFVIVSADERAKSILGYSNEGSFDFTTIPSNVKWWLSQYDLQIAEMRNLVSSDTISRTYGDVLSAQSVPGIYNRIEQNANVMHMQSVSEHIALNFLERHDIEPMLQTKWDQGYPYNSMIPTLGPDYSGNNGFATGCVATAISQILNFYKYPVSGTGSHSYSKVFKNHGNKTLVFEADFANTTYDWDNMQNTYNGNESQASRDAVGTLMYHVGVANNMNYGLLSEGGSGAVVQTIPNALIDHFNIDKSTVYEDRSCYTNAAWEELLYSELSHVGPILYSGVSSNNDGHSFVCDGYSASDNHYHMNWGWSGMYDGYYVLTATDNEKPLQPSMTDEGISYSVKQFIERNFIPDQGGDYSIRIINTNGYYVTGPDGKALKHIKNGDKFFFEGRIINSSAIPVFIYYGLKAINTQTSDFFYINSGSKYLESQDGFSGFDATFENIVEGDYAFYPVFCTDINNPDWQEVTTKGNPFVDIEEPEALDILIKDVDLSNHYFFNAGIYITYNDSVYVSVDIPLFKIDDGQLGILSYFEEQKSPALDTPFKLASIIFNGGKIIDVISAEATSTSNTLWNFSPILPDYILKNPGTYLIKTAYSVGNTEEYHYVYGANNNFLEIINDGVRLHVIRRCIQDLNNPEYCATDYIFNYDKFDYSLKIPSDEIKINMTFATTNHTGILRSFDYGLALVGENGYKKICPVASNNVINDGWGIYFNDFELAINKEIPNGTYKLSLCSRLTGLNEYLINEDLYRTVIVENDSLKIRLSNGKMPNLKDNIRYSINTNNLMSERNSTTGDFENISFWFNSIWHDENLIEGERVNVDFKFVINSNPQIVIFNKDNEKLNSFVRNVSDEGTTPFLTEEFNVNSSVQDGIYPIECFYSLHSYDEWINITNNCAWNYAMKIEESVLEIGRLEDFVGNENEFTYDGIRYTIIDDNSVMVSGASKIELSIPEYVRHNSINYNVTKIADRCFMNHTNIKSVVFPNTMEEIGHHAFERCNGLTRIVLPKNVTTIGPGAFASCLNLTEIEVSPENNFFVFEDNALYSKDISKLYQCLVCINGIYDIPNSVNEIEQEAISGCYVESIVIPEGVRNLNSAIFDCQNLESLYLPKSIRKLSYHAINSCYNLSDIYYNGTQSMWNAIEKDDNWLSENMEYMIDNIIIHFCSLKGDVNNDDNVNVTDVIDIINDRLGYESANFDKSLSDVNSDSQYTIADATAVINIMYGEPIVNEVMARTNNEESESLSLYLSDDNILSFGIRSMRAYSAFQFDIDVPYEFSIEKIVANNNCSTDFSVLFNEISFGHYRVVAFNLENESIVTDSEKILNILLKGHGNTDEIKMYNIHFSTCKAEDVMFGDIKLTSSPTGIDEFESLSPVDDVYYNVSGKHVVDPKNGIYIHNGIKVVVK